jgi:hypothetical protein
MGNKQKSAMNARKTVSNVLMIDSPGSTHRGVLQRPVHGEDGPEAAVHPRRMPHHLPIRM